MPFRRGLGLVALLAVSFSVGCSMTNPTVRGQAPDGPGPALDGPIIGSAPGYAEYKRAPYLGKHAHHDFKPYSQFRDNNFGYEGGFYSGPDPYVTDANLPYQVNGNGCPECNYGKSCPAHGCRRCGCGYKNGMPQHYQTYQYDWPQNMVYPSQGVPSGLVQYPYYTLRGPTDFFMN